MHSCRKSGKYRKLKEENSNLKNASSCFHVFRGNLVLRLSSPQVRIVSVLFIFGFSILCTMYKINDC